MTVSAQNPINRSTGNGVTTVFPYDFKISQAADIEVQVDGVVKTLNVDYTVSGVGNESGGNVTMTVAPANLTSVVRRRNMVLVRTTDYQDQGELPAATLDTDIDAAVLMIQQVNEKTERTLIMPASVVGVSTEVPKPEATKVLAWNADGTGLENVDMIAGQSSLATALANSTGSSLVGFAQSGTGAATRTAQDKLREVEISALDFAGVDATGATNSTTGLLNFYNQCIATGRPGHIPAGTYKVTPGVLVFDNGFTDKAWPNIETDGHQSTIFQVDSATETNNPVLQWKNGTASSAVGKYWRGGSHGGLTIKGSGTGAAMASQHHFSLTGTWAIRFGYMVSTNCKGSSFHLPQNLYGGTNPDPYANSFLHFDGIESNFSAGYGFYNGNYVGMDSWYVENVRIIQPSLGGWFGIGSGNIINNWSVGNVTGWAFDDGTYAGATGGSPQRNYIMIAEFDNVQYGIRLNKSSRTKFVGIRFPTRFQTTPNAAAVYWPVISVDIAGGASSSVSQVELDLTWRIEAGGVLANLGTFIQTTANGTFTSTVDWQDNGGLGVTNSAFLARCTLRRDTPSTVIKNSKPLFDSSDKAFSFARGSASTTVSNSGYGTSSAVLAFPTQLSDLASASTIYDTVNYKFTAPRSGYYRFELSIPMTVAAGTRIRLGLWDGTNLQAHSDQYAPSANTQMYSLNATVSMAAGAVMYAMGNQNTGTASVACTPVLSNHEVRFVVQEI